MVDLEAEYVTFIQEQEYLRHLDTWKREAAAYREVAGAGAHLDLAYGGEPRQRLDLFSPANPAGGPVALFIHGGYWQVLDKSSFSHMARGANAHGVTVAIAGYTLCPDATVSGIVDEIRNAVAFVARRFRAPVTVYGHSAGGHLTACMLATDWRAVDRSLDAVTVPAGLAVSGLFELEPLVATSVNARLRLDVAEARRLSPLLWEPPKGRSMTAYVGGKESPEYLRQTRGLVARWRAAGVTTVGVELAGADHFMAIAPLAEPESAMTRDLVALARVGQG